MRVKYYDEKGFYNVLAASIVFSMVTVPNYSYANELEKLLQFHRVNKL